MDALWSGIAQDFTDLASWPDALRVLVRLVFAATLGGLLGYERENLGKSAGLRTHMLVALGAAIFVIVPQRAGMDVADLSRVLQGITAGIGFIGAGTILKHTTEGEVVGLTTAAGLWLTAAIGIGVGMGRMATSIMATVLALFILASVRAVSKSDKPH